MELSEINSKFDSTLGNLKKEIKKDIIFIISHLDTDEKREIFIRNLITIRKRLNVDVCLISHINLPNELISEVDYYIYDESNPILGWPHKACSYYLRFPEENIELLQFGLDHTYTVMNQFKLASGIIEAKGYDSIYFINYDLLITEEIIEFINKEEKFNYFFKMGNDRLFPSQLLFKLDKISYSILNENINIHDYIASNLVYEYYLGSKLDLIPYKIGDIVTKDLITFTSLENQIFSNFSNVKSEKYKFFFNTKDGDIEGIEDSVFFWDVEEEIEVRINGELHILETGKNYLFQKVNEIDVPGELVNVERFQVIKRYK